MTITWPWFLDPQPRIPSVFSGIAANHPEFRFVLWAFAFLARPQRARAARSLAGINVLSLSCCTIAIYLGRMLTTGVDARCHDPQPSPALRFPLGLQHGIQVVPHVHPR